MEQLLFILFNTNAAMHLTLELFSYNDFKRILYYSLLCSVANEFNSCGNKFQTPFRFSWNINALYAWLHFFFGHVDLLVGNTSECVDVAFPVLTRKVLEVGIKVWWWRKQLRVKERHWYKNSKMNLQMDAILIPVVLTTCNTIPLMVCFKAAQFMAQEKRFVAPRTTRLAYTWLPAISPWRFPQPVQRTGSSLWSYLQDLARKQARYCYQLALSYKKGGPWSRHDICK